MTRAQLKYDPYAGWPHPCDRQEIRAFVLALAALEKLHKDKGLRSREYLEGRREFVFGLLAALRTSADAWFDEDLVDKPCRRRLPGRKARTK